MWSLCFRWVFALRMCLSLWNLDHATASRRLISLSVLSVSANFLPRICIPVSFWFLPRRHCAARSGRLVMYAVLSMLMDRPPFCSVWDVWVNMWATSSGVFPTRMRSSTNIKCDKWWGSMGNPKWSWAQMCCSG